MIEIVPASDRGFKSGKFVDGYGTECSIQESSRAMIEGETEGWYIWLGINEPELKVFRPDEGGWKDVEVPEDTLRSGRMHLSQRQVKELIPPLQYFVNTGYLPNPEQLTAFNKYLEPINVLVNYYFNEVNT